ncbi:hypothetical protein HPB50_002692 [Hyalomma asiaticum]|uniref:Uncharacterized protein n=1 Tax=Hyalomma asiaticum TaxID=266040 RepID=A0ACB7THK2_HYAAI|nr:hypothetical protein HPB50_002692 [Hyalomma asiaticum]
MADKSNDGDDENTGHNTVQPSARHDCRAISQVTKMMFIVVAIFALCWLPYQTYNILTEIYPEINSTIYYLDETWVNAGHTEEKVWEDTTVSSREDAIRKGLTTELRAPSGKWGRLIVLHAGSEIGFVDGRCLVFWAKKSVTTDYHSEVDGLRFERWFTEQLLPSIEPRSVIVMDNAPYHSVLLEKLPSTSSREADIQSWLTEKSIPWFNDQLKLETLQLVNQNKHNFSGYRTDALAKRVQEEAWERDGAIDTTLDSIIIPLGSDSSSCSDSIASTK